MPDLTYTNLDQTKAYETLKALTPPELAQVLNAERVDQYDIEAAAGMRFNFAAKLVDEPILEALSALAGEQELVAKFKALADGEVMNTGENRRVLHHLSRGQLGSQVTEGGKDLGRIYLERQRRFSEFASQVRSGEIVGSTGKQFTHIVQIGIGGSDLGPRALYLALKNSVPKEGQLNASFISNVDPDDAADVVANLNMESTLFILVSKSGKTQETLTNRDFVLEAARSAAIPGFDASRHMVVVTSNSSCLAGTKDYFEEFHIDDYIGGRYSSTSAVGGVVLSCALGQDVFADVLAGAHESDLTATREDIRSNPALLDALIGVYERSILGFPTTAILPYSQALSRFPAHLQQLDMESNGKRVNRAGEPVAYCTGPVVIGEPGTNGQHSFYQLLHQGTDIVPLQFIGFEKSQLGRDVRIKGHTSQEKLNANLAAQIVAFAVGHHSEIQNEHFPGNRPSSLLYGGRLTPKSAGALLAHYENKIMFQGFAWNLNSFDQEGVQLGKVLAESVLAGQKDENDVLMKFARLLGIGS